MKDKKALLILIPFLLFVIIIGAFAIVGDRIPDNPPETVGNTAGNLNNSGYFCEYDGKVYFANVYDSDTLYSMDPSEQDIKKLGNASVQNILAGGKFLYYYQTGASGDAGIGALRTVRSFNRCKLNGSDVTGLTRDPISTAQLVGSNLYIMTVDDNGRDQSRQRRKRHHLLQRYTGQPLSLCHEYRNGRSFHRMGRQSVVSHRTGRLCLLYGCGKQLQTVSILPVPK